MQPNRASGTFYVKPVNSMSENEAFVAQFWPSTICSFGCFCCIWWRRSFAIGIPELWGIVWKIAFTCQKYFIGCSVWISIKFVGFKKNMNGYFLPIDEKKRFFFARFLRSFHFESHGLIWCKLVICWIAVEDFYTNISGDYSRIKYIVKYGNECDNIDGSFLLLLTDHKRIDIFW